MIRVDQQTSMAAELDLVEKLPSVKVGTGTVANMITGAETERR